jgi:hypothetical protein
MKSDAACIAEKSHIQKQGKKAREKIGKLLDNYLYI